VRAELCSPSRSQATRFLEKLAARLGGDLGLAPRTLADKLAGASFAELEEFALDVRRRAVLELPDVNLRRIVRERLAHRRGQALDGPGSAGRFWQWERLKSANESSRSHCGHPRSHVRVPRARVNGFHPSFGHS